MPDSLSTKVSAVQLSIRTKLILSISVPLLITYLGLLTWDYFRQRAMAVEDIQQHVKQQADGVAAELNARLLGVMQLAHSAQALLEGSPGREKANIPTALDLALQNKWIIQGTIVMDSSNSVSVWSIRRTSGLLGKSVSFLGANAPSWYGQAGGREVSGWSDGRDLLRVGTADTRRICTYFVPVRIGGKVAGAVGLDVDLVALRQVRLLSQYSDGAQAPTDSKADDRIVDFAVFDTKGRLLIAAMPDQVHPPTQTIFDTATILRQPAMASAARSALAGQSQVVAVDNLKRAIPSVPDDSRHWLAISPIPATGWILSSAIPESEAVAKLTRALLERMAFLATGSLILMLVVLAVSARISGPIRQIAGALDRLAAGDLTVEIPDSGSRDELGRLAIGFNNMIGELRRHVAEIAAQTANQARVESELRIARQIQVDLLPKMFPPFPDQREFSLFAINVPAAGVAGDFYDFFFTPEGKLTLVIADVSGKGVPAALLMAVTRTLVRDSAMSGKTPAQIMTAVNAELVADTAAFMFVTMFLCQYEPLTGNLTYVNAGHPPPIRVRPERSPSVCCDRVSPLLGVESADVLGPYEQHTDHLAGGETLFLYTDGVSESHNLLGQVLGVAGTLQLVESAGMFTPEALCRAVAGHVSQTQLGYGGDDVTVLSLQRSPGDS